MGWRNTRSKERFARLTISVLESPAYNDLSDKAKVALAALAAEYQGRNNGNLALPWATARLRGCRNRNRFYEAMNELLEHRLIKKTHQGGINWGCSLYAITWEQIDVSHNRDVKPTSAALHSYQSWEPDTEQTETGVRQSNGRVVRFPARRK